MKSQFSIPSDHLAGLREIIFSLPSLSAIFSDLQQIRLVIDSNSVIDDLVWLARTRHNLSARTSLLELIASGTVIAYAPMQLREEVERHIARIAAEEGISEKRLNAAWQKYQPALKFCEASSPLVQIPNRDRDPNDLPFVFLYVQVGAAAIVSRDKDLPAMGANTIPVGVLLNLRDYARAKTIEISIFVGGQVIVMVIAIGIFQLAAKLVTAVAQGFSRLPVGMQIVLGLGAVAAVCHPRSRQAIVNGAHAISRQLTEGAVSLRPLGEGLAQCYIQERMKAADSWAKVEDKLQTSRRIPLRTLAYAACVSAGRPLAVHEIEQKVRLGGYRSKARNMSRYLRRVLRGDSRFLRCSGGLWVVA